jgi:hypothetical protein
MKTDKTNIVCFGKEITGASSITSKKVFWIHVLVKMVFVYTEN